MTANAMQQDRDRCLQAGMQDFLTKPIDPNGLWRMLLRWLQSPPKSDAAHPLAPEPNRDHATPTATTNPSTPSTTTPDGVTEPLPDIAGLDVELGLTRVMGKRQSYLKMLRNFLANQANTPATMAHALQAQDWETAERLAHTTKAVAGTIGAINVQALAGHMEVLLRDKQSQASIQAALDDLQGPLLALLQALQEHLPQEPSLPHVATDWAVLGPAIQQLLRLLEDDDQEAKALFQTHAAMLRSTFAQHYETILQALQQYEFQRAKELLQEALTSVPSDSMGMD
jgi:two-component system sensor histidine kinase/response regulator